MISEFSIKEFHLDSFSSRALPIIKMFVMIYPDCLGLSIMRRFFDLTPVGGHGIS